MLARAAAAYRRVDLESAPKTLIVERLYERFLRDVATAGHAIGIRDIQAKRAAINHAMEIVAALKSSLDFALAPELCANLASLYDFVTERLSNANATLTIPPLEQAARVMNELGDAFRKAHAK